MKHCDVLGNPIAVGDVVVCANGRQDLRVAKVTKITPKSVRVVHYDGSSGSSWNDLDRLVPIGGVVVVNGEDALAYVLTHA